MFGALQPASGAALTATYTGRTLANWVDFLGKLESWIDPAVERVYAVMDNLNTHTAMDVLLFALAHPRWEFVFQPKYAAYLNLLEPWWKVLRSLALKGPSVPMTMRHRPHASLDLGTGERHRGYAQHRWPNQRGEGCQHYAVRQTEDSPGTVCSVARTVTSAPDVLRGGQAAHPGRDRPRH